ncbi:MAG TPA: cupin domain-containing protein [Chloroflexota bacterium]|nr:cupin domain-containing protein [Chloroflexota bacterium]
METALRPFAATHDAAEARSFFGCHIWVKATGEQTGGTLALIDQIVPPGAGSPWHLHRNEDESFYVIEGEILFIVGEDQHRITAGPGTFVFGPRGIPHGFRNAGPTPARMLLEVTPAGFERFALALATPSPDSGAAPAGPPDMEEVMAEAAKYNVEILGPLPE